MKSIFKITVFTFLMVFMSCDNEDVLEEEIIQDETTEVSCSDDEIISYLEVCEWNFTNTSLESSLIVDFSGMNIHAYDQVGEYADEGNWSVNNGVITFNDLSATLANYIGEWSITECREDFIELTKGEEIIHLERGECEDDTEETTEVSCSDDEINSYLVNACTWAMTGGRTLGFTENSLLVYDNSGEAYEEANWSIDNGIITFANLTELQYYNGEWSITECGESNFTLSRDNETITLEKEECEETTTEASCSDEEIISYLSECLWAMDGRTTEDGLKVDFSGMNIHVYNANGVIINEGNWSIENGIITFNDLSETSYLNIYNGAWGIVECNLEYLYLVSTFENDFYISFEKDCN